jgi:hypothetical protein
VRPRLALVAALAAACISASLAPPAAAERAVALTFDNALMAFDTGAPQSVSAKPITGLGPTDRAVAIDARPATGGVYIITVPVSSIGQPVKTWTVDLATGAATFVGETAAGVPGFGDILSGFDFAPVGDRMRAISSSGANIRINPASGEHIVDATIGPGTHPIGLAYDRNAAGATATTAYLIDRNDEKLAILGSVNGSPSSPNQGAVTELAPLSFNLSNTADGGFDISASGTAYALLDAQADELTRLYTLTLPSAVTATPVATAVGLLFNGKTEVRGLTILNDDDADGDLNSADNCPATANPDQANGDGDAPGDACDEDDDNDGVSDAGEAAFGMNPGSGDSDGDGVADGADLCPKLAAATASGCNEIPAKFAVAVGKIAKTIGLATLRSKGLAFTVEPNVAAAFLAELRGNRGLAKAKAGDVVLGEKGLKQALGKRTLRITVPKSQRKRLKAKAKLTVRITATDALGRAVTLTRSVTIQ